MPGLDYAAGGPLGSRQSRGRKVSPIERARRNRSRLLAPGNRPVSRRPRVASQCRTGPPRSRIVSEERHCSAAPCPADVSHTIAAPSRPSAGLMLTLSKDIGQHHAGSHRRPYCPPAGQPDALRATRHQCDFFPAMLLSLGCALRRTLSPGRGTACQIRSARGRPRSDPAPRSGA